MTVRVGIIGVGNIGAAHALHLAREVSGATVAAVFDVNGAAAADIAERVGARVADSAEGLIESHDVDAVVIASPDGLHAQQALVCIAAGKPTLCEKPLAPVIADALDVMSAEVGLGRRLLTLGFMRRFDPGYVELRSRLASGEVGLPLLVRNIHRNQSVGPHQTTAMTLTNSAVHELDINRWLLDTEYVSAQVVTGRPGPRSGPDLKDPILVLLQTSDGPLVEIELFAHARFGYDVRCEVVASEGTLEMGDRSIITASSELSRSRGVSVDWLIHFEAAYRIELQSWVDSVHDGVASGPSVWDGYVATAVANTCIDAARTGDVTPVVLVPKPALYNAGG